MSNITIRNGIIEHPRVIQQPQSLGYNMPAERNLNVVNMVCNHHTVSGVLPISTWNNIWRGGGRNWARPGYALIFLPDGAIWQLARLTIPTWGAGAAANPTAIHMAFVGTFTSTNLPTRAAQESYAWLVNQLQNNSALPNFTRDNQIRRHSEFMNTACSGFTLAQARQWVVNARQVTTPPPTNNNNSNNANMHRVATRTGGFRTAADARANNNRANWVEPGNYHIFTTNGTGNNRMINVTTRQGTAGSWINPNTSTASTPTPQPTPSTNNTSAGRRLELRNVDMFANATIKTRARIINGTFFIWSNQVKNGRIRITNQANRVGVNGQVTGWIRTSDIR